MTGFAVPKDSLFNGSLFPFKHNGIYPPIRFRLHNGKILIDALIYDIENNLVTEIQGNEWKTPNKSMQINYDNTAFEVIDQHNIPLIQIEFYDSTTIVLGGLFYYNDGLLILSDVGLQYIPEISNYYVTEIKKREFVRKLIGYSNIMSKIFKYTGPNWVGERNLYRKVEKRRMIVLNMYSEIIRE